MKHASSTRYRKLTLFFLFQCLLLKITVVQINDGLSWSNLLKKYQEVLNLGGLYRKWQLIEIYSVNKCKNRISRCVLCFSCRFFFDASEMPANGHSSLDPNPVQLCSSTKIAEDVWLTNRPLFHGLERVTEREQKWKR